MTEPTKHDDFTAWMRLTFGPEWRSEIYKHRDMLECWQAAAPAPTPEPRPCVNCGRDYSEHSRDALTVANDHGWKWAESACPVGDAPFHPTQVFEAGTPEPCEDPATCGSSEHGCCEACQKAGTPETPSVHEIHLTDRTDDWEVRQDEGETPSAPLCQCGETKEWHGMGVGKLHHEFIPVGETPSALSAAMEAIQATQHDFARRFLEIERENATLRDKLSTAERELQEARDELNGRKLYQAWKAAEAELGRVREALRSLCQSHNGGKGDCTCSGCAALRTGGKIS